jgi:dGTPase
VSDLIGNTRKLIGEAGVQSVDDVRKFSQRLFAFSPEVDSERRQLREFLYQALYFSPDLKPEKEQAELVIGELFAFFLQSPQELPPTYQEKTQQEPVYRVVCDYIAGMTDNYVREQHRRFCGSMNRVGG